MGKSKRKRKYRCADFKEIWSRWHRPFLVCINALILVLLTITGDGIQYSIGGEGALMKRLDATRGMLGLDNAGADFSNDFFAVNVGFDRELVGAYDEFGILAGHRAVVNRGRLAQFLESIDGASYQCVLVDVQFYKSDCTDADSALFDAINRLPRIIAVTNGEVDATDAILPDRLSSAEYGITIDENNFVKYRFDSDDMPGIALAAYSIANRNSVRLNGWMPSDQGRAASGSVYLTLPVRIESAYDDAGNKLYYNLGADLLDVYTGEELADLVKDKIVVIGDYVGGDDHDTYAGTISGPVIIINAIVALQQGRHLINWWLMAIMFVVYALIVMMLLADNPTSLLPWGFDKSQLWRFLAMFFSYTTVVVGMNVIIYLTCGVMHDMFFPTLYLSILYFCIEHNVTNRLKLLAIKLKSYKSTHNKSATK